MNHAGVFFLLLLFFHLILNEGKTSKLQCVCLVHAKCLNEFQIETY